MKTLVTKFLALSGMAIALLASCKKDEIKTVAPGTGTGAALTLSTTTPALSKATLNNTAITFTAAQVNYGYTAAVTYTLQLAVKGTNFAAPTEISLTKDALAKTYTVKDFNDLLLGMKLPVNTAAQLEVRLKTSLSAAAGVTYSTVSTITATPFPLTSWIYAVGSFQGWNEKNPDSLVSVLGNGIYTGILKFPASTEFLILPAKSFANKYATTETSTPSTKVTYNAGNNLKAPAAEGWYKVTYDQTAGTISFESAAYYSLIGSATPGVAWNTDTDMKYNSGTQAWEATVPMVVGEFKVRKNHDWGTSYGVAKTNPDGKTLFKDDSNNIPLTVAGSYKVSFALSYTKTDGTVDESKAAYTLVKQ